MEVFQVGAPNSGFARGDAVFQQIGHCLSGLMHVMLQVDLDSEMPMDR
jgi:hypothetical protein